MELIEKLESLQSSKDTEAAHGDADDALIEFINDEEVKKEWEAIDKWYA